MLERRRFVRMPLHVPVRVDVVGGDLRLDANSVDISLGGVGLVGPRAPAVGATVRLAFRLAQGPGTHVEEVVVGRVVNLRDIGAAAFGVEFQHVLDESTPALYRKVMSL